MTEQTMPISAKDAVALWKAGKPVPAFQVQGSPDRQVQIYEVAFEMIEGDYNLTTLEKPELQRMAPGGTNLNPTEFMTAWSIAFVAKQEGWAKMVQTHVHEKSPAMTIERPKPKE